MTPHDVTQKLLEWSAFLQTALDELRLRSEDWAEAEHGYALARANAYLATSGTVDERRAKVDKVTASERLVFNRADGLKKSASKAVDSAQAQLSAWQTMGSILKSEMRLAV